MKNVKLRSPFDGTLRLPHCILDPRYLEGPPMDFLNQAMSHYYLENKWKKWHKVEKSNP
jgi:hypothetical protein